MLETIIDKTIELEQLVRQTTLKNNHYLNALDIVNMILNKNVCHSELKHGNDVAETKIYQLQQHYPLKLQRICFMHCEFGGNNYQYLHCWAENDQLFPSLTHEVIQSYKHLINLNWFINGLQQNLAMVYIVGVNYNGTCGEAKWVNEYFDFVNRVFDVYTQTITAPKHVENHQITNSIRICLIKYQYKPKLVQLLSNILRYYSLYTNDYIPKFHNIA